MDNIKVSVEDLFCKGEKTINGKTYPLYGMTIKGNAPLETAISSAISDDGNLSFTEDGLVVEGKAIAHGSVNIDFANFVISMYDEANNRWNTKE